MCNEEREDAKMADRKLASSDDNAAEMDTFLTAEVEQQDNGISDDVTGPLRNKDDAYVGQKSFCHRLRNEKKFKKSFIHTLYLCWAFVTLGLVVGQMGPTFPDLRLIVQKDLDTASWLFTLFSVGYLTGSLVGGILYDKFNKLLLIAFSVLGMAVSSIALPWCDHFPLMLFVRFISGTFAGSLDTGGNADIVAAWDGNEGRPFMQAVHFSFGFGGIIAPLISRPFLATKHCASENRTFSPQNTSNYSIIMSNVSLSDWSTNSILQDNSTQLPGNTSHDSNSNDACIEVFGETRVQFSYLICGVLILTGAIPFFFVYIQSLLSKGEVKMREKEQAKSRPDKLPAILKVVLIILLSMWMMSYCAVEDTYAGFLMTFCLKQLNWSKADGSLATALYWGAFSFGRFTGIFIIRIFQPVTLLMVYTILLMLSLIGLLISSMANYDPLIWMFIPIAGFSMSVIFPCIFTLTEEQIMQVTGKISAMFLISASGGLMLNPVFLGYLMERYSALWFLYLLIGEASLCFVLYLTVITIVKKFIRPLHLKEMELVIDVEETQLSTLTDPDTSEKVDDISEDTC